MGAQTFIDIAKGKDAKSAFKVAVDKALYDYGHAGYTGTIAEKHDFVMITKTKMSEDAAWKLADELIEKYDRRIDDKWGPAGCIPLHDGRFLFFGWASS